MSKGYTQVHALLGGWNAWVSDGGATEPNGTVAPPPPAPTPPPTPMPVEVKTPAAPTPTQTRRTKTRRTRHTSKRTTPTH